MHIKSNTANLIKAIIFSKDRALQLELCLRTLTNNCADVDIADIKIIYKCSTITNIKHYKKLQQKYKNILFLKEKNFHKDLMHCIGDSKFVLFIVDDNIFIRKFYLATAIDILKNNHEGIGFSLRLGKNITYHYPSNSNQEVPAFKEFVENVCFIHWKFQAPYTNQT